MAIQAPSFLNGSFPGLQVTRLLHESILDQKEHFTLDP